MAGREGYLGAGVQTGEGAMGGGWCSKVVVGVVKSGDAETEPG